jgi:hypothetical protein
MNRVRVRIADRWIETYRYEPVRRFVLGRDMPIEPIAYDGYAAAIIGNVPVTMFDLVVDTGTHQLIGNPAHGGEHILEMY